MAQETAGGDVPTLITAGRWNSSRMPELYISRQAGDRDAVARYYQEGSFLQESSGIHCITKCSGSREFQPSQLAHSGHLSHSESWSSYPRSLARR